MLQLRGQVKFGPTILVVTSFHEKDTKNIPKPFKTYSLHLKMIV
jgi:hypothetical protein